MIGRSCLQQGKYFPSTNKYNQEITIRLSRGTNRCHSFNFYNIKTQGPAWKENGNMLISKFVLNKSNNGKILWSVLYKLAGVGRSIAEMELMIIQLKMPPKNPDQITTMSYFEYHSTIMNYPKKHSRQKDSLHWCWQISEFSADSICLNSPRLLATNSYGKNYSLNLK